MLLLIFVEIDCICFFQLRLESSMIPKYLILSFSVKNVWLIYRFIETSTLFVEGEIE